MLCRVALVTVSTVLPLTAPRVAPMLLVPALTPWARPVLPMVAVAVVPEDQVDRAREVGGRGVGVGAGRRELLGRAGGDRGVGRGDRDALQGRGAQADREDGRRRSIGHGAADADGQLQRERTRLGPVGHDGEGMPGRGHVPTDEVDRENASQGSTAAPCLDQLSPRRGSGDIDVKLAGGRLGVSAVQRQAGPGRDRDAAVVDDLAADGVRGRRCRLMLMLPSAALVRDPEVIGEGVP